MFENTVLPKWITILVPFMKYDEDGYPLEESEWNSESDDDIFDEEW